MLRWHEGNLFLLPPYTTRNEKSESLRSKVQYEIQNLGSSSEAERFRTEKRKYFFARQIHNLWNSLPEGVVIATNLNSFKMKLDKFIEDKATNGYL